MKKNTARANQNAEKDKNRKYIPDFKVYFGENALPGVFPD
jgi:hypothetical protein